MPYTPLANPRAYFTGTNPSLGGAVVILFLAGISAVSTGTIVVERTDSSFLELGFAVLAGAVLSSGILWLLHVTAVYFLTSVAGGTGSVTQTAAYVGWALSPLAVTNTILAIVIWGSYFLGYVPAQGTGGVVFPQWTVDLTVVFSLVGSLWTGYLLVFAVREARNVSSRRSWLIAGTITLVSVLVTLFPGNWSSLL
jgi:hypothetical protein